MLEQSSAALSSIISVHTLSTGLVFNQKALARLKFSHLNTFNNKLNIVGNNLFLFIKCKTTPEK